MPHILTTETSKLPALEFVPAVANLVSVKALPSISQISELDSTLTTFVSSQPQCTQTSSMLPPPGYYASPAYRQNAQRAASIIPRRDPSLSICTTSHLLWSDSSAIRYPQRRQHQADHYTVCTNVLAGPINHERWESIAR